MTRKPSPKQAELSADTTSSSDESSVDIFSRQPIPGAERGFTPDMVQQCPHQTAGVESMNEGVYPMPYAAGVNYPQGYFPPSENQYGAFKNHSRPFLFSSLISHHLATPIRFDQWFLLHVLQPQSQIFIPYHQYRNQVMMPGAVQQVTRFPSAAVKPSQF